MDIFKNVALKRPQYNMLKFENVPIKKAKRYNSWGIQGSNRTKVAYISTSSTYIRYGGKIIH